ALVDEGVRELFHRIVAAEAGAPARLRGLDPRARAQPEPPGLAESHLGRGRFLPCRSEPVALDRRAPRAERARVAETRALHVADRGGPDADVVAVAPVVQVVLARLPGQTEVGDLVGGIAVRAQALLGRREEGELELLGETLERARAQLRGQRRAVL